MHILKFKQSLYRGTGAAIIELRRNPDPEYQAIVYYACTHNTQYHPQDEPERGGYLYSALKLFNRDLWFVEQITATLFSTHELFRVSQFDQYSGAPCS